MEASADGPVCFHGDVDMDARVQRVGGFCCPWTQKPEVVRDKKVPLSQKMIPTYGPLAYGPGTLPLSRSVPRGLSCLTLTVTGLAPSPDVHSLQTGGEGGVGPCWGQWGHSTCCFFHTKLLKLNVLRNLAVQLYNLKNNTVPPRTF